MNVTLRPITADTVDAIIALTVHPAQARFVATNAVSLAQALFHPEAWYRAIYDGDTPVGFAMLYDETQRAAPPEVPTITLWRFMVAGAHQGRGVGRAALDALVAHVRDKGLRELRTSCVPGDGSPEAFYGKHGFLPTGEMEEGETVLRLTW